MPNNDVFGYQRNTSPTSVISTTKSLILMAGLVEEGNVGSLVQNWNVNYSNEIQELYELGSDKIYWVKGRPVGNGDAARVVGFKNALFFPKEAFDACSGGIAMQIKTVPSGCDGKSAKGGPKDKEIQVTIALGGVVVTRIGFSATVADTRLNQSLAWRFASMSVDPEK